MVDPSVEIRRQVQDWQNEARAAVMLLTRLPVAEPTELGPGVAARAMGFYPLAGVVVGVIAGLIYAIAYGLGLPLLVCALMAIGIAIGVTGALHEDGLADMADGLGGGRTVDQKLAIMHDSRTGSYGALALLLSLSLRAGALSGIPGALAPLTALVAAAAFSRALIVAVAHWGNLARTDGLAAQAGQPTLGTTLFALSTGGLVAVLFLGWPGLIVMAVGLAAAIAVARLAERQIGGYTGDVLGGVQQAAEIAMLLTIVVVR